MQEVRVIVKNTTGQRLSVRFEAEFISISDLHQRVPEAGGPVAANWDGSAPLKQWIAFADEHGVEPDPGLVLREVVLSHVTVCPADLPGEPSTYQRPCPVQDNTFRVAPTCPTNPGNAEFGYTPLMLAARSRDVPLVLQHVACGADVNAAATDGYTALMFAADSGDTASVEALLVAGALVNARQDRGMTALAIVGEQFPEVSALLRRHGGTR